MKRFRPRLPIESPASSRTSRRGTVQLIGASNFFELAVTTAIGLFGIRSGAVLATVVEVLSEAPLTLFVAGEADRSQH